MKVTCKRCGKEIDYKRDTKRRGKPRVYCLVCRKKANKEIARQRYRRLHPDSKHQIWAVCLWGATDSYKQLHYEREGRVGPRKKADVSILSDQTLKAQEGDRE